MKVILAPLERELKRARYVAETTTVPQSRSINRVIFDQVEPAVEAANKLNAAIDAWAANLLATTKWSELRPNERVVIRAYRAAGGLPHLSDPDGLLL